MPQEDNIINNSDMNGCPCLSQKEIWRQEQENIYWKNMFPESMKEIWRYVEEACDRLDYPGSMLYDETPDEVLLRKLSADTYERMVSEMGMEEEDGMKQDILTAFLWMEIQRRRLQKQYYQTFACSNE